jgi:hypothetical protein
MESFPSILRIASGILRIRWPPKAWIPSLQLARILQKIEAIHTVFPK